MLKVNQKHTHKKLSLLRLIRNAYLPYARKEYVVALVLGGSIGGFVGSTVAVGYNVMTWVVVLSTCAGIVIGAGFTLSIIPKR